MNDEINRIMDGASVLLKDRFLQRDFQTFEKSSLDLVTEVDFEIEKYFENALKKAFPDTQLLSEENEKSHTLDVEKPTWVLDPLDGTINFSRGVPLFCISLALVQDGLVQKGWIDIPMLGFRYFCQKGAGSFCNEKQIFVSNHESIDSDLVAVGQPPLPKDKQDQNIILKVSQSYPSIRRTGSAVFNFSQVAHGACDIFYGSDLKIWDVAAGTLLVTEAGGSIYTLSNKPFESLYQKGFIASNGKIQTKKIL